MSTQPGMQPGMMAPYPIYNKIHARWSALMGLGIVMLILGSLAVIFPAATSVAVDLFLGILLLIGAGVKLVQMFSSRGWGDFLLKLLLTIVYLVAGVFLVARPFEATLTLTLLLGIFLVAQGIANVFVSLMSTHQRGWGWLTFSGIVSIILGALIWVEWPSSAAWSIGLLVGIFLIFEGWALIMLSWAEHSMEGRMSQT